MANDSVYAIIYLEGSMLINRLPELLEQREISIRQLSRDTGVTYTTIWALYHGQRRSVQLEVLDAVCEVLRVQPGEIYRYTPSADRRPSVSTASVPPPVRPETSLGEKPEQPTRNDPRRDWRSW